MGALSPLTCLNLFFYRFGFWRSALLRINALIRTFFLWVPRKRCPNAARLYPSPLRSPMTVEISCPVKLFDLLVYGLWGYFLKCFFEVFNSIRSVMFVWFFFFLLLYGCIFGEIVVSWNIWILIYVFLLSVFLKTAFRGRGWFFEWLNWFLVQGPPLLLVQHSAASLAAGFCGRGWQGVAGVRGEVGVLGFILSLFLFVLFGGLLNAASCFLCLHCSLSRWRPPRPPFPMLPLEARPALSPFLRPDVLLSAFPFCIRALGACRSYFPGQF